MNESADLSAIRDEPRVVRLELDPEVYAFFDRRADAAGVSIEQFISQTLAIVIGCRAFDVKKMACTTEKCAPARPAED